MRLRIAITVSVFFAIAGCKQSNPAPVPAGPVTSETQSPGIPVANTADGTAANTGNLVNGPQAPTGKK